MYKERHLFSLLVLYRTFTFYRAITQLKIIIMKTLNVKENYPALYWVVPLTQTLTMTLCIYRLVTVDGHITV